jgi:hypothetical protein
MLALLFRIRKKSDSWLGCPDLRLPRFFLFFSKQPPEEGRSNRSPPLRHYTVDKSTLNKSKLKIVHSVSYNAYDGVFDFGETP